MRERRELRDSVRTVRGDCALACALVITLTLAIPGVADAAEITITVVPRAEVAAGEVTVALIPAELKSETRLLPARLNSPLKIDLSQGVWYLEVRDSALWHQRQAFFAGESSAAVTADVWPRATINGRLAAGRGVPPPELTVYVRPEHEGGPAGEANCRVADDEFSCPIPSGAIDVRVRARGYIAAHFPELRLSPGEAHDVGKVLLQRGSSIIGRVEARASDMSKVRVTAKLALVGTERLDPATATPTASGLFHLDGIPPGEYRIDAVLTPDRRARPVNVIVQKDSEIELDEPLSIQQRRRVSIAITPPVDPTGARWRVQIDEETERGHLETVDGRLALDDGSFVSAGLPQGEFEVSIGPAKAGVWHRERIEIGADVPTLAIHIPLRQVRGTVKLGNTPLAAELRFETAETQEWAQLRSGEDGEFTGYLPASGGPQWSVRVRAEHPRATRTFRNLEIDAERSIDLVLQMTSIVGRVTSRDGSVVWPATVNIRGSNERLVQSTVERDGSFSIHGLPPGRYQASAIAPDMESAVQEVLIPEDPLAESNPILLLLEKELELRGTVTSKLGPVAGATVLVFPVDKEPAIGGAFFKTTDANGRFTTFVPAGTGTVDVRVAAPGLSYVAGVRRLNGPDLPIAIDERSGTVTVIVRGNDVHPVLIHDGSTIYAQELTARWTATERVDGARRSIVIPQMAPGVYTLCAVSRKAPRFESPSGPCTTATLPPFGAITLDVSK